MVHCEPSAEDWAAVEWNIVRGIRIRILLIVEETADERRKTGFVDVRRKIFGIAEASNYSTAA
jgi:hypothetical protein